MSSEDKELDLIEAYCAANEISVFDKAALRYIHRQHKGSPEASLEQLFSMSEEGRKKIIRAAYGFAAAIGHANSELARAVEKFHNEPEYRNRLIELYTRQIEPLLTNPGS